MTKACNCCGQESCQECKLLWYFAAVPYNLEICFTHEKVICSVNEKAVWEVKRKE